MKTAFITIFSLCAAFGLAAPANDEYDAANALVARDGGEESTCCGGSGWAGYDETAENGKKSGKQHKKINEREAEAEVELVTPNVLALRWVDSAPKREAELEARDGGEESTCCGGGGWFGYDETAEDKKHAKVDGKHEAGKNHKPVQPVQEEAAEKREAAIEARSPDGGEESTCCGGSGWAGYDETAEDKKKHKHVHE